MLGRCPNCDALIDEFDTATFCDRCGKSLVVTAGNGGSIPQPSGHSDQQSEARIPRIEFPERSAPEDDSPAEGSREAIWAPMSESALRKETIISSGTMRDHEDRSFVPEKGEIRVSYDGAQFFQERQLGGLDFKLERDANCKDSVIDTFVDEESRHTVSLRKHKELFQSRGTDTDIRFSLLFEFPEMDMSLENIPVNLCAEYRYKKSLFKYQGQFRVSCFVATENVSKIADSIKLTLEQGHAGGQQGVNLGAIRPQNAVESQAQYLRELKGRPKQWVEVNLFKIAEEKEAEPISVILLENRPATVKVEKTFGREVWHLLTSDPKTFGRQSDNDIRVLHYASGDREKTKKYSMNISRRHFTVLSDGTGVLIKDGARSEGGEWKPSALGIFRKGEESRSEEIHIGPGEEVTLEIREDYKFAVIVGYRFRLYSFGELRLAYPDEYREWKGHSLDRELACLLGHRLGVLKEHVLIIWHPVNLRHLGLAMDDCWLGNRQSAKSGRVRYIRFSNDAPLPSGWSVVSYGRLTFSNPHS